MTWRYYVRTAAAANGLWVDDNAQLSDVELTYELNSPFSGKAFIPYGQYGPNTGELLSYWKRFGAAMYAEEDGEINWGGMCVAANPAEDGLVLEFIGSMGWMAGIPWNVNWESWEINAKTVIDMLVAHSQTFYAIGAVWPLATSGSLTGSVGDEQPPDRNAPPYGPQPPRLKGQSKSEYEDSGPYLAWLVFQSFWNAGFSDRETYKIQWWNSPYLGGEIEDIIQAIGANYRESYSWLDSDARTVQNLLELGDSIARPRYDVKFEDGVNIAQKIDTKDNTRKFFHQAFTLGSGEGLETHKATQYIPDGEHFYQGYWGSFRDVYDNNSLQNLANNLVNVGHNSSPIIDNITVWDIVSPAHPRVSSLRVGDIVNVVSNRTLPAINQWCRITKIVRKPEEAGLATLTFQIVDFEG